MIITKEEKKEIERVCGEDFDEDDVPAIWRKEEMEKATAEDRMVEELIAENN